MSDNRFVMDEDVTISTPRKQPENDRELLDGVKVEEEHRGTYDKVKAYVESTGQMPREQAFFALIAKDHLKERSDYYTKLKEAKL